MRRVLADRPERIAILGSGGLSHQPRETRGGWIDEPLDRWFLQALERGQLERLTGLFTFDSETMRSGTGELRCWLVAAGACEDSRMHTVDYIPAHHTVTGLGFAYWQ
jgi:protocatechuate 4,5-dioxygenase beta chain